VAQGESPEFKPQYHHQKKKKVGQSRVPVTHTCNPSRKQRSGGLQFKASTVKIVFEIHLKKGLMEWLEV
jgi:hypothetical protein